MHQDFRTGVLQGRWRREREERKRSNGELAPSKEEKHSNLLKTPDPCTLNEV